MSITFPSNTKEIIDEIRSVIGREITVVYTTSGTPCPLCSLDPVTNTSVDPFCSGCAGDYWINTSAEWETLAHIRWRGAEKSLWVEGGIIDIGDCKVTIAYSGVALDIVRASKYFIVDGKELYMKDYALKGAQEINRIAITLLEDPNT